MQALLEMSSFRNAIHAPFLWSLGVFFSYIPLLGFSVVFIDSRMSKCLEMVDFNFINCQDRMKQLDDQVFVGTTEEEQQLFGFRVYLDANSYEYFMTCRL